jgi:hypothetical protein
MESQPARLGSQFFVSRWTPGVSHAKLLLLHLELALKFESL